MTSPLDRLDASQYGDRGDGPPEDVAPPCAACGQRERLPDSRLCEECGEDGE